MSDARARGDSRGAHKAWRAAVASARAADDLAAAIAETERVAAAYPDQVDVQRTLAELYVETGDGRASIAVLQRVLALDPTDSKSRQRLSLALALEGAYEDAIDVLHPVAEANPTARTLTELGALYLKVSRPDAALIQFQRAVGMNGMHAPAWERIISVLDALGRHHEASEARRSFAAIVPKFSTADVVRRIRAAGRDDADAFVVNIGCRDGKGWGDPCYELYKEGYPGLAVDAGHFPELQRNLPQSSVRKMLGVTVTPFNVIAVLAQGGCPDRPSLLKIDIDGFDGVLLEAALARVRPNVIQIEVNPQIPPPLKFAIQYDPRYKHSGKFGFFGCSVSYVLSICRPLGFELLQIDLSDPPQRQDIILVKREYLDLWDVQEPVNERALFLEEPVAVGLFEGTGVDPARWREQDDDNTLLTEVWDACVRASLKRSGKVLPFILSL